MKVETVNTRQEIGLKASLVIGAMAASLATHAFAQTASEYTTYYQYDAASRPIMKIGPDPDGSGALKRRAEKTTYDPVGRIIRRDIGTVDDVSTNGGAVQYSNFATSQTILMRYDAVGNKTQIYAFPGTSAAMLTHASYDMVNRTVCTAVRMNSSIFVNSYNGTDRPDACALGVEGGEGPDRVSKTIYDAAGQKLQTLQAVGTSTQRTYGTYTYTLNGKQETVADANGNVTKLAYDGHDRLVQQNFPSTTRGAATWSASDYEQYAYDPNGNRITLRKRDGATLGYGFDALDRMVSKGGSSIADVSYTYDLSGRQVGALFVSSSQGVNYTYDTAGRQKTEATFGRALTYSYDKAGNRTQLTWPDGYYLVNAVDGAGRLKSVALNAFSPFVTYGFDDLGRRTSASLFNGATSNWGYDSGNRLSSLAHDLPGAGQDISFGFGYNSAGQTVSQSASNGAYVWAGNGTSLTAAADGLNRDAAIAAINGGGCAVSGRGYDCNGSITDDGAGRAFAYDGENRLTALSGPASANLEYDPLGRLSKTTINGSVTQFLYSGDKLVAEYDASGNVLRRYAPSYGVDEAIVWWEGGDNNTPRSLHADRQGSVIAAANYSSAQVYSYGPYGEPGDNWGVGSRFRYTGQIALPELKLYHYKARAYDPARGWFLQTDPVGYDDDLNLYAYTAGDPLNKTDPAGSQSYLPPGTAKYGAETIDDVQNMLSLIGVFDPPPVSDGLNAAIYGYRGQKGNMAISGVAAALPYVGDVLKGGRVVEWVAKTPVGRVAVRDITKGSSTPNIAVSISMEKFEDLLTKVGFKLDDTTPKGTKIFKNEAGDKFALYAKSRSTGSTSGAFTPAGAGEEALKIRFQGSVASLGSRIPRK